MTPRVLKIHLSEPITVPEYVPEEEEVEALPFSLEIFKSKVLIDVPPVEYVALGDGTIVPKEIEVNGNQAD